MVIRVVRINTTPVKGTALDRPERVDLGSAGVQENRLFHFVDARGTMINGKRAGELVRLRSRYDAEADRLSIGFPDGRRIEERVRCIGETVTTDFYGRPVRGHVVDGPWSDAVSEFARVALRLVRIAPGATGTDVHPVTLISRATMEHVRSIAGGPAERWEDRFRMLFELDGLPPYEEDAWIDRSVAIGEAILRVIGPVPRCVVTTHDPANGVPGFDTLGALRRARAAYRQAPPPSSEPLPDTAKLLLGVYATVEKPGRVSLGSNANLR
ncbi:MAG: MOSC domain-containing protein [Burkholderiaceae bacterium]|nr:MOSC domain-containing protein [Burkholderiaceae bacterium]